MNEQATEALARFLEETLREGKDFVFSQAPDVVQQALAWGFWSNLVGAAISLAVITCFVIAWCWALDRGRKDPGGLGDWAEENMGLLVVGGIGSVFLVAIAVAYLTGTVPALLKVMVAPKLYLIDKYLAGT